MKLSQFWIAGICLLLGMGAGLLLSRWLGNPSSVVVQFGSDSASGDIRVYVSGAVQRPGVYPLRAGDRVVDAVEAAGGPSADANTEGVNFAQRVQDEGQVRVPHLGEVLNDPSPATQPRAQLVDINHASDTLLRSLPGIGATQSANIVASRNKDGLFQQTDELVQRKLVTQATYTKIKDLIEASP